MKSFLTCKLPLTQESTWDEPDSYKGTPRPAGDPFEDSDEGDADETFAEAAGADDDDDDDDDDVDDTGDDAAPTLSVAVCHDA